MPSSKKSKCVEEVVNVLMHTRDRLLTVWSLLKIIVKMSNQ